MVDLVDTYASAFSFVLDLCLFGKCLNQILNLSLLVDQNIEGFLKLSDRHIIALKS